MGVPVDDGVLIEAVNALAAYGSNTAAADALGIPRTTLQHRLREARIRGITPDIHRAEQKPQKQKPQAEAQEPRIAFSIDDAKRLLLHTPCTLDEIAERLAISRGAALDACDALRNQGMNLIELGGRFSISKEPVPQHASGEFPEYVSRPDDTFVFGFTSDNHIGSKYARNDVLETLYDHFAEAGVDRVFNAGNWVDGEARFNKFDLLVHGMDAQLAYLAEKYPQRPGIKTYAVAGDDHEGWWAQREGVDIGRYAEMKMRQAGRDDFVNLGYMEAFVKLVNRRTGESSMLLNCHPGGGSAYAISYTSQKSVEAFEGGEKPAVALFGHYHKMAYNLIRNVHCIQTGCTLDQTPFMRKKKISAHIGGGIAKLTQDPATGAIIACQVQFFNFFNQGYYNNRWNMAGDVTLAERA